MNVAVPETGGDCHARAVDDGSGTRVGHGSFRRSLPERCHATILYDDYRIVRNNLLRGGQSTTRDRPVPYTVYIDPQLGRIGLTEQEARAQGRKIRVAKLPMTSVARAIEVDETRGFMKAVVDAETNQILGAAVLGVEGGEVMGAIEMAMMGKLPYTALRDGVFAHPTLIESLNNLFLAMDKSK